MDAAPPRPLSPSLPTFHDPLPPTLLPSDPSLLSHYLRSHQLSSLRHLYGYKTSLLAQESAAAYESSRGRGGRARRRRGSSPLIEKEDLGVEDERDLFEVRKKFKWDPAIEFDRKEEEEEEVVGTAEMLVTLREAERERRTVERVDPNHTYDLVYDLTPDLGSDSYYHGPHPEPPARVVRTILKATKQKPFIDPDDLSTVQLEGLTRGLWEQEGRAISVGFGTGKKEGGEGLTREEQRVQKVMEEDELADWEESVIAGFSSTCNERIGRGRIGRPLEGKGIREMANHLSGQTQSTTTSSAPPTAAGPPHMASQLTAQGYAMGQVQGQAQLVANQYGEREREREYHQQQQNAMGSGAHWR